MRRRYLEVKKEGGGEWKMRKRGEMTQWEFGEQPPTTNAHSMSPTHIHSKHACAASSTVPS